MELLLEEIIEEILYKLPPKALLRFKSVCKSWRSRISSPYFIKNHLNRSTDFAHQNLILNIRQPSLHCLKSASLQYYLDREPDNVVSAATILDYSVKNPFDCPLRIHGSCNGLILLTTEYYGSVFLWNPSTRKARNILHLNGRRFISEITVYGFGYDESSDDYRVVCIYTSDPSRLAGGPCETDIYSLRNDSWKRIENFYKGASPVEDSGTFVNGRLHWIASFDKYDGNVNYIWDIVCLDLGKEEEEEKYEVVAKPDCFLSKSFRYPQCLRVLGGNLGLVCYNNSKYDMSVWVMKEYGVRESWVKILNISNPTDMWVIHRFRDPMKLCKRLRPTKNGDSVLAFGSTLIFYDGQDNLHNIKVNKVRESTDANVYVESLFSPFGKVEPPNLAIDLLPCWLKLASVFVFRK